MEKLKKKIRRIVRTRLFLALVFILGLLVLVYPLISSKYYEINQNKVNNDYEKRMALLNKAKLDKIIEDSKKYNEGLSDITDGIFSEDTKKYVYNGIATNELPEYYRGENSIARLRVPKIDLDLPVYFGVREKILRKGVGCMLNTSLPVGGRSTHSVLTGHRGLPEARLFRDLDQLKEGNIFLVEILGRKLAYKVDSINIIDPTNLDFIQIEKGRDLCTLLTCHPYMINNQRLLVRGHRIQYSEYLREENKSKDIKTRLYVLYLKYREYLFGFIITAIIMYIGYRIENKKAIDKRRRRKRKYRKGRRSQKNIKRNR